MDYGIKSCSECEINIRCEECVYNKQSIETIKKEVEKATATKILQRIGNASGVDYMTGEYLLPIRLFNKIKEDFGVGV